jgi:hypothetical protein
MNDHCERVGTLENPLLNNNFFHYNGLMHFARHFNRSASVTNHYIFSMRLFKTDSNVYSREVEKALGFCIEGSIIGGQYERNMKMN